MSDFFEQKEKSLIHFRDNINKFIKGMLFVVLEAKTLKLKDQITIDVMTQILQTVKVPGLMSSNGKIDSDLFYEILHRQEGGGHALNRSDFHTIFGQKKQIKISDISNVLKKYNLESFELGEEIKKNLFDRSHEIKISHLNKMMQELGWGELNAKNKQIVGECFDFNNDKKITSSDIEILVQLLGEQELEEIMGEMESSEEEYEEEINSSDKQEAKSKRCSITDL